jgi:FkbM family methyltransferase
MKPVQALRYYLDNRCAALGVIRWLKRNKINPRTLVDAGANNSQWMLYLADEWPMAKVISFEPQARCKPIGTWHKCGLSDKSGAASIKIEKHRNDLTANIEMDEEGSVPVFRLDQFAPDFEGPALLKVDCEDYTLKALLGAGDSLSRFACVVVEVMEDIFDPTLAVKNQHQEIHTLMASKGFNRAMTVSACPSFDKVTVTDVLFWKEKIE